MKHLGSIPANADEVLRDPRWAAVAARDSGADGEFVYAVSTTGIYCRPSCPSRLPRPEHVLFFASASAADAVGFRPCLRCKPQLLATANHYAEKVVRACRLLESGDSPLGLAELASAVGLSKDYFQKIFKRVTGVTPKAYAQATRARKLREQLAEGSSVTDAIFAAGYNANSRFYSESNQVLGMTASAYRSGGAATEIRFAVGDCSLGAILVAQTQIGICAILIGDEPETLVQDLQKRFPKAQLLGGDSSYEHWVAQVVGFVEAPALGLNLPLDIRGTAFQQRVWQALREIPAGTTMSYTDIARRIGAPKAYRAVALACAANPLAVAIPCHRVVRSDGDLSGYRWGIERKRTLLDNEARQALQMQQK